MTRRYRYRCDHCQHTIETAGPGPSTVGGAATLYCPTCRTTREVMLSNRRRYSALLDTPRQSQAGRLAAALAARLRDESPSLATLHCPVCRQTGLILAPPDRDLPCPRCASGHLRPAGHTRH